MTHSEPGAALPVVANLRDLGGWRTESGRVVRNGMVFRSAGLARANPTALAALTELGVRTVYDLRTTAERDHQPYRLPAGMKPVVADVLADHTESVPAHLGEVLRDPPRASEVLRGGIAEELLSTAYRQMLSLPSAHAAYRRIMVGLLGDDEPAVLVHCTTGKDRTGWAAAALLLLLGVPERDVLTEYLLTNTQLLPALAEVFDRFAQAGGDPDVLRLVLGVQESYLRTALVEMAARYGTVEQYFETALGIGPDDQERLREHLLVG